jgi:hypothetical protein
MMKIIYILCILIVCMTTTGITQNCCAPSVPQQGVLGETVALPHMLDIGVHYEFLRTDRLYTGSDEIEDYRNTESTWNRTTLSLSYGIMPRLSISVITPYLHKKKSLLIAQEFQKDYVAEGLGDILVIGRFSLIPRDFVTYRELSVSAGIKIPTGSTDRMGIAVALPQELQPGTGSWDFTFSAAFYQGFEPVDFILSMTYTKTSGYEDYRFGNQFYYSLSSNVHVTHFLDLSAGFTGSITAKDEYLGEEAMNTGRRQIRFVPGIQAQVIPEKLRAQLFFETPIYQHFEGSQLGGGFNIRASLAWSLPLAGSGDDDS